MLDAVGGWFGETENRAYVLVFWARIIYAHEACVYEPPRMQIAFQTRRERRIYLRTFCVRKSKDIPDYSEYMYTYVVHNISFS